MSMTLSGSNGITFNDASTQSTGKQACKAWVSFNGNTGATNAAYNVSSVTRNSAGVYTANFTTALADTNYAISGYAARYAASNFWVSGNSSGSSADYTTTSAKFCTCNAANSINDPDLVTVSFFGS